MLCTPCQILSGCSNQQVCDGWGMWHEWGTGEEPTGFDGETFWKDHLEDLGVGRRVVLKII